DCITLHQAASFRKARRGNWGRRFSGPRAGESGPGPVSFLVVLRLPRRRGRVELDQGLRFLVGQPQDQVVVRDVAGQRVVLVPGERLHLRRGRARQLAGFVGLALPEQTQRPIEGGNARHGGVVRSSLRNGEQVLLGGRVVAAAVLRHAQG